MTDTKAKRELERRRAEYLAQQNQPASQAGVTEYYEVGPMKQIKAMMKRINPKVWGTTTNVEV